MSWTSLALLMLGVLVGMVAGAVMTSVWLVVAISRSYRKSLGSIAPPRRADLWGASTREPMTTGEPAGWAN